MRGRWWRRVHWASAGALALAVPLGLCTGALDDAGARDAAQRLHVLVAAPVVVAAGWRLRRALARRRPAAAWPAARLHVERAMLALLLALGISGLLALVTGDTPLVPWALEAAGVDGDAGAATAHRVLGWLLLALILVHLAGALRDRAVRLAAEVMPEDAAPGR